MKNILLPYLAMLLINIGQAQPDSLPVSIFLHGNNVKALVHSNGLLFQDQDKGQFAVDGQSTIRAAGLWLAGVDPGGNLKTSIHTYLNDSLPDFIPGLYGVEGDDWNRIFTIPGRDVMLHTRDYGQDQIIDDTLSSVFGWPGRGNPFFEGIHGFELPFTVNGLAGFWDENGDDIYDPSAGDYPRFGGRSGFGEVMPNESAWLHFHDKAPYRSAYEPLRMGVDLGLHAFTCKENEMPGNSIVAWYKLTNHALEDIDSCYFGVFLDFAIGCPDDDYIACIPDKNILFAYNSDDFDESCDGFEGYGENPPAAVVKLLRGPLNENREVIPLSHLMVLPDFPPFPGMGFPETRAEYYNYLTGRWKDGTPLTKGGNGYNPTSTEYTHLMFPGHVFDSTGWSELTAGTQPGHRRVIASFGPFVLQPGAANEIVLIFTYIPRGGLPGMDNLWQIYSQYDDSFEFINFNHTSNICTPEIELPPILPPKPEKEDPIKIAPNPASNEIRVTIENPKLANQLIIYDALGRKIFSSEALKEVQMIDVSTWQRGLYFAVVNNGWEYYPKSFIVMKP